MEPCEVVKQVGPDRLLVRNFKTQDEREVHMEDVVVLPEDYVSSANPEEWKFPDPEPVEPPEDPKARRSPGKMLEDPPKETAIKLDR